LNKPVYVQFVIWIAGVLKGNLGNSIFFEKPVLQVIAARAETSIFIATISMAIIVLVGITVGIVSAIRYNSTIDQVSSGLSMFGASIPTFWLGLNLMLLFAVVLRWLPSSGFPSVLESGDVGNLRYLILPSITLEAPNSALIIRLTRSSMLDVLREDYVMTARSKGLSETRVNIKHVFRNALISIVAALGFTFVGLASGTVVTETVFALPGIGRLVVEPAHQRRCIGACLMDEIEKRFPKAERFELFTGHKSEQNLRLYAKLGYRPFKREKISDRLELVYLEKIPDA